MSNMSKPKVPISAEDQAKPYYKYYLRETTPVAPQKMSKIFGGAIHPTNAIPFSARNQLLALGQEKEEIGYCVMPDGTGYVADVTFMPGATTEMIHWWFAWRGLDSLRYVIADPYANIQALTMQSAKAKDSDLTDYEKFLDTTQVVISMGETGPITEFLNFKYPSDMGFHSKPAENDRFICARGYGQGQPPFAVPDYFVCHQICPVDGGVVVKTKYWLGWTVRYGKDENSLLDSFRMPPMVPMARLVETAKAWGNLAEILPQLYAEEKGTF